MTAAARVRARRFGVWFVAMALAIAWSVILLPTASADKTINGCTIVDNPTPTRITTCQGADLPNVDLNLGEPGRCQPVRHAAEYSDTAGRGPDPRGLVRREPDLR